MRNRDMFWLALRSAFAKKLRAILTLLSVAIGIGSVVAVNGIGEGTRDYIMGEFTQFGTNILAINPGKTSTGGMPGTLGNTTRPLTMTDAREISRLPGVKRVVPLSMGAAPVEVERRSRSVYVFGVNADGLDVWKLEMASGDFIPPGDPRAAPPVAVLGPTVARELFPGQNPVGQPVRIGGSRMRVIGLLKARGQFLGIDMDDAVYVPTQAAIRIFRSENLQEIDISTTRADNVNLVAERVREVLIRRHDGEEDFTITTQDQMMSTLDNVINTVTIAVTAIGSISLLVGGVGILTIMWITVRERRREIGLFRAVGAGKGQVLTMFLFEAGVLGLLGGVLGLFGGASLLGLLHLALPAMPILVQMDQVLMALGVALGVGLLSGVLPARKAASLDPVLALRAR